MAKGIIILGSSRSKGDTYTMAEYISGKTKYPIIDLKQKKIAEFDYDNKYDRDDEFMPLIRDIADNYDLIIFASPVYWYSMSGIMKTFFDRLSDIIRYEKDTGRKLRGKSISVVSCSGPDLVDGYYMPYRESANYLGMNYKAEVHAWLTDGKLSAQVKTSLDQFISKAKD